MDRMSEERYGPLAPDDLVQELWPWRGKPVTNTAKDVARRRRQLWQAFYGTEEGSDGVRKAA